MKIIKLTEKHYILVDDKFDPIGSDGKYVHKSGRIWQWDSMMAYVSNNPPQLITHSTQPLELICCTPEGQIKRYIDCKGCDKEVLGYDKIKPFSLSEVKELLGVVDVEMKAKQRWGNVHRTGVLGYIEGYKQALEDNKEKKYTEEDMLRLLYWADSDARNIKGQKFEQFIQSLQPKTEWEVEIVEGKLKLKS